MHKKKHRQTGRRKCFVTKTREEKQMGEEISNEKGNSMERE
jgi:hypothetical protein